MARQQAMEMVATEHAERFLALVDRACGEVGLRSFGDDVEDLAGDVCETGRLAGLPAGSSEVPPKFFSGVVDGPDFCTNLNLGWPLLHASDSDGDGVADVCSLPSTRREAAVRQQALEALAAELPHEFQAWLARVCWSVLVSADFGDREADLAGDACAPGVIGVPDVPGVPGGLSVVSRDGYLEVAWSAPADDGGLAIAGYELRYRQADGDSWASHPSIGSGTNTVITGLAAGTSYEVQVRAVNPAGTSKWSPSATGTTGAPPSAISGLEVVGGDQRLSITWEPPANDGGLTITSYELRYRQADGGSWSSHPHPGSDTDAVVYRLATGVSYEVQVRAVNPAGAGGWSLSAFGATGAAPGVLGRPEVVGSYRRLSITWEPPADDGGLAVTGYELRYRRAGGGSWTTHPHRGLGTSWEITRLPNGLIYEVQVRAVNPAGPGEWSPSGSGAAESPPGAMDEPRVLGGYRLLRVWWTPPADDGGFAVTGYQVRYRDSADGSWTVHSHDGLATDTTIDGLEDETIYKVQVRATNSAGYGRWSPTATVATASLPPGLPATPGALTLARGVEKIDASWTAPDSNRSPITDYDVRYRACTGTGNNPCATAGTYNYLDDEEENAENTATTATITGLTNGTTYQVQVRATNEIGDSEWSDSSAAKPADKPSQPVAPILHAGASEQITVYWWTPEDNGEPISSYTVQYRQGTSGDWTDVPVSASSTSANSMATQTTFGAASSTTVQETTISNLTNDTTYQVRVGASNAVGPGAYSTVTVQTASATAPTVPGKPTGLQVTQKAHQMLTLGYTAPTDDGGSTVIGYVFRAGFPWYKLALDNPTSSQSWPTGPSNIPACVGTDGSAANRWGSHEAVYHSNPQTFANLNNSTNYFLSVLAVNLVGCSSWSTGIWGQPEMQPPTNLVLTAYQDGVQASWTAPIGSSSGYEVQYQACTATPTTCTTNPTWGSWTAHSHSGNSTTARITGLTYGTAYKVRVRAKAGSTTSTWLTSTSSPVPAKSAPDAPARPTLVSGNAQLKVDWSAPTYNGGSAITDYDVQYKASSASDWTDFTHTGTATTATITQLTNGTTYSVRVRAVNDYNGDNTPDPGAWSSLASEKTGKPAKMAAPSLTSGTSSLVVSWPPATDNGSAITGYRLRYKRVGTWSSETSSWLSGSTTTTTITSIHGSSLSNGSSYTVQIQARNANGWTEWSDTATEKVGKPGKIRISSLGEHRYTESGSTKVGFSAWWQKPSHPPGGGFGISEYDMDYRKADATTWQEVTGISKTLSSGGVTVKPDPSPDGVTVYEIRLRAKNSAGYGPWTERLVIVWPPPAAPTNVKFIAGDNHLRLEWTPPSDHGKGRVTAYYAEYRTAAEGGNPAGQWQTFNGLLCVENRHDLDLDNPSLMSTDQMGITNGTKYDVRIQAINHATNTAVNSYSPWSTVVSVTAGSGKPWPPYWQYDAWTTSDFFPGNYPTVTRGDKQLTVALTWPVQVPPNNGGSAVTDYDVRYRVKDTNSTTPGDQPGSWLAMPDTTASTAKSVVISDATNGTHPALVNGTTYEVQIRAGNSNGDGDWTPSFPGTPSTSAPAAPAAPTDVKILSGPLSRLACGTGSGQLTVVGLTLPSDNGGATVDHLQVRYRETGTTGTWTELSGTQIAYSFTPPKRGTSYDVQVRLKNSVGWGAWSATVAQTTNKPLPATMVNAAPGNTQLYVRAGAGYANGSSTTGFQLRYRGQNSDNTWPDTWTTVTRTGTKTQITAITGLTNGTKYEIQARTTSNNGNSEWSSSAFATPAAP